MDSPNEGFQSPENVADEIELAENGARSDGDAPPSTAIQMDGSTALTYTWTDVHVCTPGISKAKAAYAGADDSKTKKCCPWSKGPKVSHEIIKGVSGVAYPYEALAIMGSSGAGKTTLLNVLTGSKAGGLSVTGERCINERRATPEYVSSVSAYVHQDDLFIGALTVREHLTFVARVRMRGSKASERRERVKVVMQELGLTKCADTKIGDPSWGVKGISGGEMRRLSFASEILTDPSILFCDEPTSGLDSFMSQTIVELLKALAKKGKTILCTIHQPSSQVYSMFDKIMYLAEGQVAYAGPLPKAVDFFASVGHACPLNFNPSDFIIQLLAIHPDDPQRSRELVASICDAYTQTGYAADIKNGIEKERKALVADTSAGNKFMSAKAKCCPTFRTSWCNQFCSVLWRSTAAGLKDPLAIWARIVSGVIVATVIGLVYWQQHLDQQGILNINGSIFCIMIGVSLMNCFSVTQVICSELPVFYRDYSEGLYGSDVYILARSLAELPIFLFVPALFATITWWMVGYSDDLQRFLTFVLMIMLLCNVSVSFGYLCAIGCGSLIMACIIMPLALLPFLIFAGFLMIPSHVLIGIRWIHYTSWFFYGWEVLAVNQWEGVTNISCPQVPVPMKPNMTMDMPGCRKEGKVIMDIYEMDVDDFYIDVALLFVIYFVFRISALVWLSVKARKTRA